MEVYAQKSSRDLSSMDFYMTFAYFKLAVIIQQIYVRWKRGQTQDAVGFYQLALQSDPQFAEALLNLGHALMSMGQEEEARSHWRRAIREKPELAQTYFEPATTRQ